MGETRNQRRTRRRRETRDDREVLRFEALEKECSSAPIMVFHHWEVSPQRLCGYIYNDVRFANGSYVHTGEITYNKTLEHPLQLNACHVSAERVWCAKTPRTTYNVKHMSSSWMEVGAGNAFNRLKYKLWPKLVIIALLLRARRRVFAPNGPGYRETMAHFMSLTLNETVCD